MNMQIPNSIVYLFVEIWVTCDIRAYKFGHKSPAYTQPNVEQVGEFGTTLTLFNLTQNYRFQCC